MNHTGVRTTIPYALIWDEGTIDISVAQKLYTVDFKRLYREGSNNVEVRYDRLGTVSHTAVQILFPTLVENEDDLVNQAHRVLNRLLDVYRVTTGEFYVDTLPKAELRTLEVHTVTDQGAMSPVATHIERFGHALSIARSAPIPPEALAFFADGAELPMHRVLFLNARREQILENYRLSVVEAETAFEVMVDEVVSRYYRTRGHTNVEITNQLKAGLQNLLKGHIPRCCGQPFVDTEVHNAWNTDLYMLRNSVVHDGASVKAEQAAKALDAGNKALEWLSANGSNSTTTSWHRSRSCMPPPAINPTRLNRALQELGRIGESPHGMQREAYSPEDVAGRRYVIGLMDRAGLKTWIDAAGNIIGRKEGSSPGLPAIAMGSHTDTVPNGGKYDGALGVIAAIECVQNLADSGHSLRHPVEVLVFSNEEGTRYHRWLLGSRAMAGLLEPADLNAVDDEGKPLSAGLAVIGGDLTRIAEARRRPDDLAAYLELHIEQGPTLDQSGASIGVVTGITGRSVLEVQIKGTANHAGTTPMAARHDALVSASKLVLTAQRLATDLELCRVATVGSIQAQPNAVNVVPGAVGLGVEFRDLDMASLAAAEGVFRDEAGRMAAADEVTVEVRSQETTIAVPIDIAMQTLVQEAAEGCGLTWERLPSGAGHDAQAMAAITQSAMIFVPSVAGISHSPQEYTKPEDCANGARVLLNLLLLADQRL